MKPEERGGQGAQGTTSANQPWSRAGETAEIDSEEGSANKEPAAMGPLTGVRVLEMGSFIAGPFAGQLLADMGADVIKVEDPQVGDPIRTWGQTHAGRSIWWSSLARNKRIIAVDLRQQTGRDICWESRHGLSEFGVTET